MGGAQPYGTFFVRLSYEMGRNLSEYDLAALRSLYEEEKARLTEALLSGAPWDTLREQRYRVTELSIAVHRKATLENNPAENNTRRDS